MKKYLVFVMVVISLFLSVSVVTASEIDGVNSSFIAETNSELVGSYISVRCNYNACWNEWGSYTAFEVFNPFVSKFVGLGFLYFSPRDGQNSEIIFRAAPGYHWEFSEGGLFSDRGYTLVRD